MIYCKLLHCLSETVQFQLGLGWCAVVEGRTDVLLLLLCS